MVEGGAKEARGEQQLDIWLQRKKGNLGLEETPAWR